MTSRDLSAVVRHYRSNYQKTPVAELAYFASRDSDEEAVFESAISRINGKRLSHQRRLASEALAEAGRRLNDNLEALRASADFDELFEHVEAIIGPIPGIGELAVYDIALRIGARFGSAPERIYLHAGTRKGAKALGLDWRRKTLELSELPPVLRKLSPREAEDVLCIYKSSFADGAAVEGQRCCSPAVAVPFGRC